MKNFTSVLVTLRTAEYDGYTCTRLACLATDGKINRCFSAVIPPADLTDTYERDEAYRLLCDIISERTSRYGIFLELPFDTLDRRVVY